LPNQVDQEFPEQFLLTLAIHRTLGCPVFTNQNSSLAKRVSIELGSVLVRVEEDGTFEANTGALSSAKPFISKFNIAFH